MPLYEYECKACGEVSEALQKFSDPPLKKCPLCGGRLKKLISLNNFQLKGSGWYVTDYARKDSGRAEAKKTDQAEKTESKEAKKEPEKKSD